MSWVPVLKKNLLKSILADPVKNMQNALPKIILTITFWKNYKNNARDTNYFTKNYKVFMWWVIIDKWKYDINSDPKWKLIRGRPHQHFVKIL